MDQMGQADQTTSARVVNLNDLLNQLVMPAEPAPVPMVPQTWGWIVLALILLAFLAYGLWRYLRHRRDNAYRRAALRLLDTCGDDPARIAEILRRTALVAYPRIQVASLAGDDWLKFLDRHARGSRFQRTGRDLALAPYCHVPADPALTRQARDWVRRHHRDKATS